MKKLILLLLISFAIACENKPEVQEPTADQKLKRLVPPVVVISAGKTVWNTCSVKLIDANGTILTLEDNSMCSLRRGDTLIHKLPLIN